MKENLFGLDTSLHEQVLSLAEASDNKIQGFIAIHNTTLGPAVGGTRLYPYSTEKEALYDALRLSEAMTSKCAIAGLPFGGGKGVIIFDPTNKSIKDTLKIYAEIVGTLQGKFYTGEDVGLTEAHVQYMLQISPYFIGRSDQAGDPSTYAALSTFYSIQKALQEKYGDSDIEGRTFAIKGVGKTGSELARLLTEFGGNISVADTNTDAVASLKKKLPKTKVVSVEQIHKLEVDVYAPCALGDDITFDNIDDLRIKIVAGTANNQLQDISLADMLWEKNILHVPGFLANAGGLIDVADELLPGGFNRGRVLTHIGKLGKTLSEVLEISNAQNRAPDRVAEEMVGNILARGLTKVI